jgi:hypothetical protein
MHRCEKPWIHPRNIPKVQSIDKIEARRVEPTLSPLRLHAVLVSAGFELTFAL